MSDRITHAFSFGGGVQSTACLVLAATGRLPEYRDFVMADVGADSENPATIRYVEDVARPYAEANGLRLAVIPRTKRDGTIETLYGRLVREGSRSLPIPVRMSNTGAPGTRSCTADFKIKVLSKWAKSHGATAAAPMITGIGISLDEATRMKSDSGIAWQTLDYPLIRLRLSRTDCQAVIREAGLPPAPKSSCFFCPLHTVGAWKQMAVTEPELFERSAQLEGLLNDRRKTLGKDPVYFCSRLKPLREAIQMPLFQGEPEEQHSCGPFVCSSK